MKYKYILIFNRIFEIYHIVGHITHDIKIDITIRKQKYISQQS